MRRNFQLFLFPFVAIVVLSCGPSFEETEVDLSSYQVEGGIVIQPLAAEPLIEAPIDLSFDDQGRLWALEMSSHTDNIKSSVVETPTGRIVVLEDLDADGQADHTRVFLDSLQLARSIAHVYRGLLYAEPPNLWFVEINDDLTPGKRMLVDPSYAIEDDMENQPIGLLISIDNWIYSAHSSKRYRRINGDWYMEPTANRGQWGITRDEIGRLIYNLDTSQVRGDQVLPNLLVKSGYQSEIVINTTVIDDQRIYPIQPTAVNRGETPNTFHEHTHFAGALGPVFLQGSAFPAAFQNNVLVCAPEVNLIKRNVIEKNPFSLSGRQVWQDKEFIASSDEGFRPVNLKNGPDGALYIADMHSDQVDITSNSQDQTISGASDGLKRMGRILRVTGDDSQWQTIDLSVFPLTQLVDSLSSKNIWIRDRAQQMIVYSGDQQLSKPLVELLNSTDDEIARIHAFYCLEGLQTLSKKHLNINNMMHHPRLLAHVLKLMGENRLKLTNQALSDLIAQRDSTIDYYTTYLLAKNFSSSAIPYLTQILDRYDQSLWIAEPLAVAMEVSTETFRLATNGYETTLDRIDSIQQVQALTP